MMNSACKLNKQSDSTRGALVAKKKKQNKTHLPVQDS